MTVGGCHGPAGAPRPGSTDSADSTGQAGGADSTGQAGGADSTGQAGGADVLDRYARLVLVGSPNAGKTSIFNGLTGLHAKTGDYPGVTVSYYVGSCRAGEHTVVVEDLPGAYSLEPISPDEQVAVGGLQGSVPGVPVPDAVVRSMPPRCTGP